MAELAVLQVVPSEPEAEMIRGLLRSEGIPSIVQRTTLGAGMADGFPGASGPLEILVHAGNLPAARRVLEQQSS
ncbi:MAG: putative signal transducing protein [Gaiellaceae bacterium]